MVDAFYNICSSPPQHARFATARLPENGRISYKRFAGDPDFLIDFDALKNHHSWSSTFIYNDLEAAAYCLPSLKQTQLMTIKDLQQSPENNHKILIAIGTGVGHAACTDKGVFKTMGGHYQPVLVTDEHHLIAQKMQHKKGKNDLLIMEDFLSSKGLIHLIEIISNQNISPEHHKDLTPILMSYPDAGRLFFEFLGLHMQIIASATGFYGGIYISGGVIDHLVAQNLAQWDHMIKYFIPDLLPVVKNALDKAPIFYVKETELPLLGLTYIT